MNRREKDIDQMAQAAQVETIKRGYHAQLVVAESAHQALQKQLGRKDYFGIWLAGQRGK